MNIIVVIIDTLRYDHIAANGNPLIKTPNLDRLIRMSWNFHRAFAASFPTIPHRTDVMTGRYGAPFHPWKCLSCDVATIPRVLAEYGYCSQLIHDTPHLVNGGHGFDVPFDAWTPVRGAEVDRAWISDSWEPLPNWKLDPMFDAIPMTMEQAIRGHHALTCYVQTNRHREKPEDWNAAELFLTAADFLRDNTTRDNFFLWVDCFDPHEPWDAPPEFVRMYDQTPGHDGTIDPRIFSAALVSELPEECRQRLIALYRAKVTHMDKWLGTLLDTLEETGLNENTALILTADHGTNIGDRDNHRFGKTSPPCENEAHVPFVVCAPNAGSGESQALVQPQDIFATALSLAGVDGRLPEGVESHDVLGLASDSQTGPRQTAVTGTVVGNWRNRGRDAVLFSAFDREWRLGFAANAGRCELQRLGTREHVADANPDVVTRLHAAAIDEMARRGLDPQLVHWLKSHGETPFSDNARATDAAPPPNGWKANYWRLPNQSLGLNHS